MESLNAFATTLPVILLVLLGLFLKRKSFFSTQSIAELKKLVVNIALPMVLLNAFGSMQFQTQYLIIVTVVFIACIVIMNLAAWLTKKNNKISNFTPMIFAGFEAGMIGYAVYTSLYGLDRVKEFAIIDLGQVLFVFFILVPTLHQKQTGNTSLSKTVFSFLKTPVIIAIASGIFLNLTSVYQIMEQFSVSAAILETSRILSSLTMPLAALILGYELNLQPGKLQFPFFTALIRLGVWLGFAAIFNFFVIRTWLGLSPVFEIAVWFMFILPPPFVVPLYLQKTSIEDRNFVLNTITISTVLSLISLIVLRLIFSG